MKEIGNNFHFQVAQWVDWVRQEFSIHGYVQMDGVDGLQVCLKLNLLQ